MPAARRFVDAKFIQADLGVSKVYAYNLLHMFGERGQLIRPDPKGSGKGPRTMRVRATIYEAWLEEQDGGDPTNSKRKGRIA